jgi:hypothetical protein
MKRKLLLLLAFAGTLHCFAQKDIKAGIIAGATYSKLNVDLPGIDWKYAPNFMIGMTAEKPVTNNLSVFANLNYERRTSTIDAPFSVYDSNTGEVAIYPDNKITATISYLSIPVSVRYYFGAQKRFCANLGLYADIYLSDKAKSEHSLSGGGGTSTSFSNYSTVTLGLNPGVGYSIPLKNNTDILIDLRYNAGITKAVKNSDTTVNSLILAANYRFNL